MQTIERLSGTKPGSTLNRVYSDLLKGEVLTSLQGLIENQTMHLGKYISLLRNDHNVPVKDRWVHVKSGKRVKEYFLDPAYRQRILSN